MIYPFDQNIMLRATNYLCSFLPTSLPPHEHNDGFKYGSARSAISVMTYFVCNVNYVTIKLIFSCVHSTTLT